MNSFLFFWHFLLFGFFPLIFSTGLKLVRTCTAGKCISRTIKGRLKFFVLVFHCLVLLCLLPTQQNREHNQLKKKKVKSKESKIEPEGSRNKERSRADKLSYLKANWRSKILGTKLSKMATCLFPIFPEPQKIRVNVKMLCWRRGNLGSSSALAARLPQLDAQS